MSGSLTSHDLDKHRAQVGLLLHVQIRKTDKFGWDRLSEFEQDEIVRDWIDALQDYPLDELRDACREAVKENPNKCPNEGHVLRHIQKARARIVAMNRQPHPEPERERVSPERAAEIMDEVGLRVRRFG